MVPPNLLEAMLRDVARKGHRQVIAQGAKLAALVGEIVDELRVLAVLAREDVLALEDGSIDRDGTVALEYGLDCDGGKAVSMYSEHPPTLNSCHELCGVLTGDWSAWPASCFAAPPLAKTSPLGRKGKTTNSLVSKICSRSMMPSPPQSLVPLGVFSSSLLEPPPDLAPFLPLGAGGALVASADGAAAPFWAGASSPAAGAGWSAMFVVVVAARRNVRGAGAGVVAAAIAARAAGGLARNADLVKLASVAIRIHVVTLRGAVANSFVAQARKEVTKYEECVRGGFFGGVVDQFANGDSSE